MTAAAAAACDGSGERAGAIYRRRRVVNPSVCLRAVPVLIVGRVTVCVSLAQFKRENGPRTVPSLPFPFRFPPLSPTKAAQAAAEGEQADAAAAIRPWSCR